MDKGGEKATKIIQILKHAQDGIQQKHSIQAHGPPAVPRDIANIVASNRSEAKSGLTNTEAATELPQKLDWKYTFLQDEDGYLTE